VLIDIPKDVGLEETESIVPKNIYLRKIIVQNITQTRKPHCGRMTVFIYV
jgi:hypothetical protein